MFTEIVGAITGIFVVVYDGQHALRFTLGRATGVVGPGVNFKWPMIQRFRVVDTKDTTIDLEPQIIQLSDDLVYEVCAKAVYQIVDVRKALIEIEKEDWARQMQQLLRRACHAANLARERGGALATLKPRLAEQLERRYDAIVAEGLAYHDAQQARRGCDRPGGPPLYGKARSYWRQRSHGIKTGARNAFPQTLIAGQARRGRVASPVGPSL